MIRVSEIKSSKIKVSYVSDLHLDFHVPFNKNQNKFKRSTIEFIRLLSDTDEEKEVLVIAGDISHFNLQSYWAVEEFSKNYKKVLICYGNHDYYLISKSQSNKYSTNSQNRVDELTEMLKQLGNVHIFTKGNTTFRHKDILFGGLTMWYPLGTSEQKMFFHNVSNDSQLIKGVNIEEMHKEDIKEYERLLKQDVDVMISHVPVINIDSHFKYNSTACYLTRVKDINAKHWIMAHSHEQRTYKKPYCSFHMNAIGYPEEKLGLKIKFFTI